MFRNVQELLVVLVGCVHLAGCMAPTAVCPLVTLEEPFLICSACLSRHTASLMHSQWYINDEQTLYCAVKRVPFTKLVKEPVYRPTSKCSVFKNLASLSNFVDSIYKLDRLQTLRTLRILRTQSSNSETKAIAKKSNWK